MVENNKQSQIFETSIITMFLIGNLIIRFPKGEGQENSFISYLICFTVSVFLTLLLVKTQYSKREFSLNLLNSAEKSISKLIVKVEIFVFAVICFTISIKDYCLMLGEIRLENSPRWILCFAYLTIIVILSLCKGTVLEFFAFTNLIIVCLGIILMFAFSAPMFDFSLLKKSLSFDAKNVVNQALTFFIHSFGQLYLCILYLKSVKKQNSKNGITFGVLLGGSLLLLCFLNVILTVGSDIVSRLDFPYASVTAIIVSGDGYNRMDVITYYIYFVCNLIKSVILLKVVNCLSVKKSSKTIVFGVTIITAFVFSSFGNLFDIFQTKTVNFILLCLEILAPIFLCILLPKFKKKIH